MVRLNNWRPLMGSLGILKSPNREEFDSPDKDRRSVLTGSGGRGGSNRRFA